MKTDTMGENMKRFLILSLVLAASLMLAGCGGKSPTYTDASQTINTRLNQEFIIALDSNPTTGYDWEESHDNSILSLMGKEYKVGEKAPGLVGAGGTQYFRFKALKTGKTEITLTYKRPWEEKTLEQKTFTVDIK